MDEFVIEGEVGEFAAGAQEDTRLERDAVERRIGAVFEVKAEFDGALVRSCQFAAENNAVRQSTLAAEAVRRRLPTLPSANRYRQRALQG